MEEITMKEALSAQMPEGMPLWVVWLVITYGAVMVAMTVDFVAGLRKAKIAGIATSSRGLKMTCRKASGYFLPMVCLSCIDLIASVKFSVPFLTMVMGAFNIACEWKSVMESAADKARIRDMEKALQQVAKEHPELFGSVLRRLS